MSFLTILGSPPREIRSVVWNRTFRFPSHT